MGYVWDALEERNMQLGPHAALPAAATWRNWRLSTDGDGIAWLLADKAGASANTLSEDVLTELNTILGVLEQERPRGLVIRSAKRGGFIAGADIGEFQGMKDAALIEARLRDGHAVLDRLAALPMPTVAVIHGYCLGGGLEVALACRHRIAIDGAKLGFPEVMLGLHPGLGGTFRSLALINPAEAMSMMLTGRNTHARRAKALGLVDAVTEERHVLNAVRAAVDGKLQRRTPGLLARAIGTGLGRRFAASRMRSEAEKKAPKSHYPAPYKLIDLWEEHGADPKAMQTGEIQSFARLLASDTAQNLIRVFFLRERMKKLAGKTQGVRHVHVIGAGAMGGDIAAWCAWQGLHVTLADMKPEALAKAVGRAATLYGKIGKRRTDIRDALDRLVPDLKGEGVRHADVVIEAVPEILDLKHKVFAATEPRMKPGAILATNTSSIPLERLREGLKAPERLVGLHFFNPVSRMELVEVVSHDAASEETLSAARAFTGQISRLPAPVKSAPGFLVNRALTPYIMEAMIMLDEGVKKETIDHAAERFGMPMGPIELADQVGLDICAHVADVLRETLDPAMPQIPDWLRKKVEAGHLGRKTGKGLYEWKGDHPVKEKSAPDPAPDTTDRLILPMLNVCVACLREGVVADEETIDGAMIFGTGFAPFRGGPMHYARNRGIPDVMATMRRLADRYGERFRPDDGWGALTPEEPKEQ